MMWRRYTSEEKERQRRSTRNRDGDVCGSDGKKSFGECKIGVLRTDIRWNATADNGRR
jgi:hypothetical protein